MMLEQNPIYIRNADRLIVHNGVFHADDVLTAAMLKNINPDIEVIRTRTPQMLKEGLNDPDTIAADVGMGRFDHHQEDAAIRGNGNKYSACGLIYEAYPEIEERIPEPERQAFMDAVLSPVQDHDNGIGNENEPDPLTDFVSSSLPNWEENVSLDDAFNRTVTAVQEKLHDLERGIPLQDILKDFSDMAEKNREKNLEAEERGNALVRESYESSADKNVIVLPGAGTPWQKVLPETEAKFVVFEASDHSQVNIQAVPPETGSFDQKIPMKKDDEMFRKAFGDLIDRYAGSDKTPFVHPGGFFAAFPVTDKMTTDNIKVALGKAGTKMAEMSAEKEKTMDRPLDQRDFWRIGKSEEISEEWGFKEKSGMDTSFRLRRYGVLENEKTGIKAYISRDGEVAMIDVPEKDGRNAVRFTREKDHFPFSDEVYKDSYKFDNPDIESRVFNEIVMSERNDKQTGKEEKKEHDMADKYQVSDKLKEDITEKINEILKKEIIEYKGHKGIVTSYEYEGSEGYYDGHGEYVEDPAVSSDWHTDVDGHHVKFCVCDDRSIGALVWMGGDYTGMEDMEGTYVLVEVDSSILKDVDIEMPYRWDEDLEYSNEDIFKSIIESREAIDNARERDNGQVKIIEYDYPYTEEYQEKNNKMIRSPKAL